MPWKYQETIDDEDSEETPRMDEPEADKLKEGAIDMPPDPTPTAPAPAPSILKWSLIKDLLVIGIIPLALWMVKVEVTRVVQQDDLEDLVVDIDKIDARTQSINDKVQQNSRDLAVLNDNIGDAKETINEIENLLRR